MAISFACTCGSTLKAKEEDAGKRTKCPKCGKVIPIPGGKVAAAVGAPGASGGPDAYSLDLAGAGPEPAAAELKPAASGDTSLTIQIDASVADRVVTDPLDETRPTDGTKQYKVLTPKDYGLPGKFNPPKLEETLNMLAQKGWSVKSSVVVHVHSHSGAHDELVVILER